MKDNPIRELLPVHWFLEINKEEVVDRIECLKSEISERCLHYDELKCSIYNKKEVLYENCMLEAQRKYSLDEKEFCHSHYYESEVYSKEERTSLEFFESYHSCLLETGSKKGKNYCNDIIGTDELIGEKELYECYALYNVNITEYGADKGLFENPPNEDGTYIG
jgi:hypothetical protein